eukprot:scpid22585/ scgid24023/ 
MQIQISKIPAAPNLTWVAIDTAASIPIARTCSARRLYQFSCCRSNRAQPTPHAVTCHAACSTGEETRGVKSTSHVTRHRPCGKTLTVTQPRSTTQQAISPTAQRRRHRNYSTMAGSPGNTTPAGCRDSRLGNSTAVKTTEADS